MLKKNIVINAASLYYMLITRDRRRGHSPYPWNKIKGFYRVMKSNTLIVTVQLDSWCDYHLTQVILPLSFFFIFCFIPSQLFGLNFLMGIFLLNKCDHSEHFNVFLFICPQLFFFFFFWLWVFIFFLFSNNNGN